MHYLLIDVGGSAIKYAVSDKDLVLSEKGKVPSQPKSPKEDYYSSLSAILNSIETEVCGIAISMPGIIDYDKGFVHGSSMLKEGQIPIVQELQERFHLPVSVMNDGFCAAEAEIGYGNMQGIAVGAVLVLGTGIGGAIVIDHKLFSGSSYSAGNLSFLYSDISQPQNYKTMSCMYNGISGLKDAIKEKSGLEDIDGIQAFELIKEGNEDVRAGLELFCDRLAFQIYNLQAILDMDRVLIGGGISNEPTLIDYVKEAADRRWKTAMIPLRMPEIMNCRFNNDANLLGALYHFRSQHPDL